jgi:hypothetical protein
LEEPAAAVLPTSSSKTELPAQPPKNAGADALPAESPPPAAAAFPALGRLRTGLLAEAARPALLVSGGWALAGLLAGLITQSETVQYLLSWLYNITKYAINWDHLNPISNNLFSGIFCGVILGLILKAQQIPLERGRLVKLALAWTVVFMLTIVFYESESLWTAVFLGLIVGGLGGWATGALLARERPGNSREVVLLATLGWSIGLGLSVLIIYGVYYSFIKEVWSSSAAQTFFLVISLGVWGFTGGLATFYALKSRVEKT